MIVSARLRSLSVSRSRGRVTPPHCTHLAHHPATCRRTQRTPAYAKRTPAPPLRHHICHTSQPHAMLSDLALIAQDRVRVLSSLLRLFPHSHLCLHLHLITLKLYYTTTAKPSHLLLASDRRPSPSATLPARTRTSGRRHGREPRLKHGSGWLTRSRPPPVSGRSRRLLTAL